MGSDSRRDSRSSKGRRGGAHSCSQGDPETGERQEADHGHGHGATQHLGGRGRAGGKTASKKGWGEGTKAHNRCFF